MRHDSIDSFVHSFVRSLCRDVGLLQYSDENFKHVTTSVVELRDIFHVNKKSKCSNAVPLSRIRRWTFSNISRTTASAWASDASRVRARFLKCVLRTTSMTHLRRTATFSYLYSGRSGIVARPITKLCRIYRDKSQSSGTRPGVGRLWSNEVIQACTLAFFTGTSTPVHDNGSD